MRLINANTLKGEFTGNFMDAYPTALVHTLIDSAPTIDAVPVVHGYWIDNNDDFYPSACHCSVCGMDALTKEETDYDYAKSNYCSYCGATMDGDAYGND